MKTVFDAVNEFKGEWDNEKEFIYVGTEINGTNDGVYQFTYSELKNNTWDFVCTNNQFKALVDEMSNNLLAVNKAEVTPPVFTEAMNEDRKLPPIGSQYLDEDGQLCAALLHYGSFVIGEMLEHINLKQYPEFSTARNDRISTLTPPITLEDGERYEFEYNDFKRMGYYNLEQKEFTLGSCYWTPKNCTNIKLLEVKS